MWKDIGQHACKTKEWTQSGKRHTYHPDIGNNRQIIKITMINPFNK